MNADGSQARIMKILYVTHKPIYPVTGGDCIRMSQILDELLQLGDVDVMYLVHDSRERMQREWNPAIGTEYRVVAGRLRRLMRAAATMVNRKPLLVNLYRHGGMRRRSLEVAPRYDAVVLGSLGTAHYCMDLRAAGVKTYLDLTDSPTMNLDNEAMLSHGWRRLWTRLNVRRMRRLETLWRATVPTAFISEIDRDYLPAQGKPSVIVSNSVALPEDGMTCSHENAAELLFVGQMGYAPNITAMRRFVADVLPRVAAEVPDVKLHIVGGGAGEEVRALGRGSRHVVIEGFVDDLGACYRDAGIFVAPMYSGSGIQNKILQALAAGCCVVTTPIGAEGLDAATDAFVVARSDEEMAQAVIRLTGDAEARRGYGRRARAYVAEAFSAAGVRLQLKQFIIHNA